MIPKQFINAYLEKEEYGINYQTKYKSCDFLQENEDCKLGDCKPYNCKKYPYTDQRREIIEICKRKGISYVEVVRNNERYQMMECEKLCEECIN